MHHRDRVRRHTNLPFSDELINLLAEPAQRDQSQQAFLRALDRCFEKLNEKQRNLIEQRYTPGKSLETYATELGTSAGSLRITLHRIRQALKRCVESTMKGEPA